MSLICIRIRNSFPFEWLYTGTRFETEAYSNSEMGYLLNLYCAIINTSNFQLRITILITLNKWAITKDDDD